MCSHTRMEGIGHVRGVDKSAVVCIWGADTKKGDIHDDALRGAS